MKTVFRANLPPFGLYDMITDRLETNGDSLIMHLPEGLIRNEEPYQVVRGAVQIEQVDLETSFVYLLAPYAMLGQFSGRKIELRRFLDEFTWRDFEISNEYHGRHSVIYKGYFSRFNGEDLVMEAMLEISHYGDIVYEAEE